MEKVGGSKGVPRLKQRRRGEIFRTNNSRSDNRPLCDRLYAKWRREITTNMYRANCRPNPHAGPRECRGARYVCSVVTLRYSRNRIDAYDYVGASCCSPETPYGRIRLFIAFIASYRGEQLQTGTPYRVPTDFNPILLGGYRRHCRSPLPLYRSRVILYLSREAVSPLCLAAHFQTCSFSSPLLLSYLFFLPLKGSVHSFRLKPP